MASLKEVKGRINSIHGTLKITSANEDGGVFQGTRRRRPLKICFPTNAGCTACSVISLGAELSVESPFAVKREVKKVAVVVFASNSSLCGGFNANVIRHLNEVVAEYEPKVGRENILIYPVGRKVADAVKKMEGLTAHGDYQHMSGKPNYQEAADLAAELMTRFASGEIQQVESLLQPLQVDLYAGTDAGDLSAARPECRSYGREGRGSRKPCRPITSSSRRRNR